MKGRSREDSKIFKSGRLFLQPLALAVVCLVFLSLLFIVAYLNLRALDETFTGYMENRGLTLLKDVRQASENGYHRLVQTRRPFLDPEAGSPLLEDAFSLEESFLVDLTEVARNLDVGIERREMSGGRASTLLHEEGILFVACVDRAGEVGFSSGTASQDILQRAASVIDGSDSFKADVFGDFSEKGGLGFIALRRLSERGTIILALDEEGFRRRAARFSVLRAIEEISEPDVAYAYLTDPEEGVGSPSKLSPFGAPEVMVRREVFSGTLDFTAPVGIDGIPLGALKMGLSAETADRLLAKNRGVLYFSIGLAAVIALLSMWLLYRNQNRYLGRMQGMQRRIDQAQRLSALGRFAAGVAHEIRNPLNAISMAAQRLERETPHRLTAVIRDEIGRLNRMVEEFLGVARGQKQVFQVHDVYDLLDQVVLLMAEDVRSRGIRLERGQQEGPLPVPMDVEKMKQAVINILKNGMEAIPGEGRITLSAREAGKGRVLILISDSGLGLNDEEIGHIFEPDYTTKEKGLGLGLPLTHEIVRGHGGEIRVSSRQGRGTTFEILLPTERERDEGPI